MSYWVSSPPRQYKAIIAYNLDKTKLTPKTYIADMLANSLEILIGIAALRKRNQCIFCQGSGMSKEHFWSSWIGTIIPKGQKTNTQILLFQLKMKI